MWLFLIFSEKSHFFLYMNSGEGFELAFSAEYRRLSGW